MPTLNILELDGQGRSPSVGPPNRDNSRRLSHLRRVSRLAVLTIGVFVCPSLVLWAQASGPQGDGDKSWTATTESRPENANPTRTFESHTKSGNRTLDRQSLQRLGPDGNFEPFQDLETETVQVDPNTVRTTTRTFVRGANGEKSLLVTDEEQHNLPNGDSKVVRSTSNVDINGKLELVQRQIEETRKTGKDSEETKTTVMFPGVNGGLAPAMKMEEVRKKGADNTSESRKTTMLPDGSGNWQVSEVRQTTTKEDGKNSSTEERVSRADSEGKLGEVSRTMSKESAVAAGEKRKTVETYSADVPGTSRDGSLQPD